MLQKVQEKNSVPKSRRVTLYGGMVWRNYHFPTPPNNAKIIRAVDSFLRTNHANSIRGSASTGTGSGHARGGEATPPKPSRDLIELGLEDEWLKAVTYVEVGPEGERMDKREYVTHLNAAGLGVELFGEKGLKEIIEDLNESVFRRKSA